MHSPREIQMGLLPQDVHTRASLLARVRDWGDDASWEEFFITYWRLIYSLAIKAGLTETEAEEVAQATMIAVADSIRHFEYKREAGSFKHWLCCQTNWKIHDHLRRFQREREVFLQNDHTATSTGTGAMSGFPGQNEHAAFIEQDWNQAVTATALARVKALVKPKHFQIFDLYVIKHWPLRRISRTLGVSVAQVYVIKYRISRLLKKQVKEVRARLERLPSPGVKTNQNTTTV